MPAERLAVYDLPDAVLRFGLADLWWSHLESEVRHRNWPIPATGYPGKIVDQSYQPVSRQPTGANLIMIQMESVDPWVIEADVRDRPVMPFLRSLQERAMVFRQIFAQHSGGGSSDAELATMLSLLPLTTHSGLLTAQWNLVDPLPRHLASNGYTTVAMHANRATYFNRDLAYPRLGFQQFLSEEHYQGEARGWQSKDEAFLAQSIDVLSSLPEPFFTLLITMQSHGPFTNHDRWPEVDPGPGHHRLMRDYMQCMKEVDRALELFFSELDTRGLLERSVVVLYGDHSSQVGDISPLRKEQIPLLVLAPGHVALEVERLGSHLDLAPTVLDLLGVNEPASWLGTSLLCSGSGKVLFNDLNEIEVRGGSLVVHRAEDRMPFMLYSAWLLDQ